MSQLLTLLSLYAILVSGADSVQTGGPGTVRQEAEQLGRRDQQLPTLPNPVPEGVGERVTATHYCTGYSGCGYEGNSLGCGGTYSSFNESIVAVGPSRYAEWPCGTQLRVCEAATGRTLAQEPNTQEAYGAGLSRVQTLRCISVVRQDSCPGCSHYLIDLSEAGFERVCGPLSVGVCEVTIEQPDSEASK